MAMNKKAETYSNTRARNTMSGSSSIRGLIDWVSFTLPVGLPWTSATELLQIPDTEFILMPKGRHGYKTRYDFGHISILADGAPNMGVHVVMTGQGCREFEALHGNRWAMLFKKNFQMSGHFSRLDLALDDMTGHFTFDKIAKKVRRGEIRSYFKTARVMTEHRIKDGANVGTIIYLGSGKSEIFIRIYDKLTEQQENKSGLKVWNRVEIECRNKRADALALAICTGDMNKVAAGVLKSYVNFVDPGADSNRARWKVSKFWVRFLGEVERIRLTISAAVKTIQQKYEWVLHQVAPTLAMLSLCDKYSRDFICEIIREGMVRLRSRHLLCLQVAEKSEKTQIPHRRSSVP